MITIEHLGIPANDTKALAEWYRDTLGFRIIFEGTEEPKIFFVQDGNGMVLEIVPPGPDGKVENAHNNHMAVIADDFEKAVQDLQRKGVEFEPEKRNEFFGGTRMLFFTDPEGHRHQLIWRGESITK